MASLSDNDKKLDMDASAVPYNVTPHQLYSSPPALTSFPNGTDIPVSRPSPFGASFAGPSHNVAHLDSTLDQTQPPTSYYQTHYSSPSTSSSSCGSNRHATHAAHREERKAVKALEKSVKHEKKLLAREESQLSKTAKREAKALRKEVEHHAKVLTKELKNSAQETVASMKRSLRDKFYEYEQQWNPQQEQQHQQQRHYNDRHGCSRSTHKTHPRSPSQPITAPMLPPQVPHSFAPPHIRQNPPAPLATPLHHHHNSHHVVKQQRKLEKHLNREQKRQLKIGYKQQREVDRLVRHDCHRHHRHNPPHSFPIRILGGVISKGLDMLMNGSSSQHPPQRTITVAPPPPLSAPPAPPLAHPSRESSSSSPSSCSRSEPKSIGPQEPVLVYSMTHMSLNPLSAPSAPTMPHHEPTSITLAVPRPDLELYRHDEDEHDTSPPPSYESATRA